VDRYPGRFIQREVDRARLLQAVAVDFNFDCGRVDLACQIGDDISVDLHTTLLDQFFNFAAAPQPGSGQNFIQTLCTWSSGTVRCED
jgi:hypothetical protein